MIPSSTCRVGCGACCIAPSISSPIPGMPHGKPAGVRCVQLSADNRCALFGLPERPAVCASLQPSPEMCGATNEAALVFLERLERATAPDSQLTPALTPCPSPRGIRQGVRG
ncbi:MAG: YkgJ family cysteine cluster protein [Chloroflexales bacterium]|nr:YkgJ family cysteine cluster protein [Chloroflexales bacterium]